MKSADDHANDVKEFVGGYFSDAALRRIAQMFAEHARDQRHLCAEAAQSIGDGGEDVADFYADKAHAAVMNARAPGT